MTHPEQIMRAAASIVRQGHNTFSRREVRDQIGVAQEEWMASYTAVFQGMREDHPGGAPPVGEKFRGVFRRVGYGQYVLTNYGKGLAKQY